MPGIFRLASEIGSSWIGACYGNGPLIKLARIASQTAMPSAVLSTVKRKDLVWRGFGKLEHVWLYFAYPGSWIVPVDIMGRLGGPQDRTSKCGGDRRSHVLGA